MSAGVLVFSVASVCLDLPGIDLPRFGEPLHPHVCDTLDGRNKPESQERRCVKELALKSVLYKQGRRNIEYAKIIADVIP